MILNYPKATCLLGGLIPILTFPCHFQLSILNSFVTYFLTCRKREPVCNKILLMNKVLNNTNTANLILNRFGGFAVFANTHIAPRVVYKILL